MKNNQTNKPKTKQAGMVRFVGKPYKPVSKVRVQVAVV